MMRVFAFPRAIFKEKLLELVKMEQQDVAYALRKTQQAITILGSLWERRLNALTIYFERKQPWKFAFWHGAEKKQAELQLLFEGLRLSLENANAKEERALSIIGKGIDEGVAILERAHHDLQRLQSEFMAQLRQEDAVSMRLQEEMGHLLGTMKQYRKLLPIERDILSLERELLTQPTEERWQLYLRRIDFFTNEMKQHIRGHNGISGKKHSLVQMQKDIDSIRMLASKKEPVAYIAPSAVSALVRVGFSNIAAGLIMGNPFKNPYFLELSAWIFVTVIFTNFVDYYFNIFTSITQKTTRLLRIAR